MNPITFLLDKWRHRLIRGGNRPVGGPDFWNAREMHRWHVAVVRDAEITARSLGGAPWSHEAQLLKVAILDFEYNEKRQDADPYTERRSPSRKEIAR